MKKEYTAPELQDLGSVAELTLGSASGNRFDAIQPIGGKASDATFFS